jgi:glycosyltransferase involved in cell wall biosynthesis
MVNEISKYNDVTVLTRENNRNLIEKELNNNNLRFLFFDLPNLFKKLKHFPGGIYLYYILWQIGIILKYRKKFKKSKPDIIHHLTFGNWFLPTFVFFFPGEFVFGPAGIGKNAPIAYLRYFSLKAKINELFRFFFAKFLSINPSTLLIKRFSTLMLVVSDESKKQIRTFAKNRIVKFSQVGINLQEIDKIENNHSKKIMPLENDEILFLLVGRLVAWKGFAYGIQAFNQFLKENDDIKSKLIILGDGPEKYFLKKLVKKLNLTKNVFFLNGLERPNYLKLLKSIDILLHPSLHEPGSFVLIEAMACKKPVIVNDFGEPSEIVTDECGIKIPIIKPELTISKFAEAMKKLAGEPKLRRKMGEAGRKRVQEQFSWEKKGTFINEIYQRVLAENSVKQDAQ